MPSAVKTVAYSIVFAALATFLGSCGDKKPSTDAFKDSIGRSVAGYSIKDLRCESFADKSQEEAGRGNCRGTLALMDDLYSLIPQQDVASLLASSGIPASGTTFFQQRHPKSIFVTSVNAGAETSFTSECNYFGSVDGQQVNCNTTFTRFGGQPMGSLGSDYVIKDSPEYTAYVNEVLADYRQLDAAFKEFKAGIDRFFSVGRTITSHVSRARVTSPLTWSGEPGFLGYPGQFSLETKYQDLPDHTNSTFCGYPKGKPEDDILFSGEIGFSRDRNTGQENFTAKVYQMNRYYQGNKFQSCGNYYNWNGTVFVSIHYSLYQIMSQ